MIFKDKFYLIYLLNIFIFFVFTNAILAEESIKDKPHIYYCFLEGGNLGKSPLNYLKTISYNRKEAKKYVQRSIEEKKFLRGFKLIECKVCVFFECRKGDLITFGCDDNLGNLMDPALGLPPMEAYKSEKEAYKWLRSKNLNRCKGDYSKFGISKVSP